ncbi:MAG TPA: helix-turn-helix domain-containing protein [Candidatus Pelethocola excrementipullorum]|nr:helix-turn-helix domain-containing protein [Candidatus Pelethocola excrementipullorum]
MKKEIRTVCYDEELRLEAYRLKGIVQPFPNHFHEHYVIGFMESGQRYLSCRNKEYKITKGDILLFHPGDNHACAQCGEEPMDYRGFNIPELTMLDLAEAATGIRGLPRFSQTLIQDQELACYLAPLHQMVMHGSMEFEKEEYLLLLISSLINKYGQPFDYPLAECSEEIEKACNYIRQHYTDHICLDQICSHAGLSKSSLLRAFTKSKGITPYRYLETIRINEAKKLLEQGITPVEAAMRTGFSDQSHFTNFFSTFIGLSPGVYREIFQKKELQEKGKNLR